MITDQMVKAARDQLAAMNQIVPSDLGMRCAINAALDAQPKTAPVAQEPAWSASVPAGVLTAAAPAPVAQPTQCAQCKKQYRHGSGNGCPKCAPGVSIAESEFCKPIASPEPVEVAIVVGGSHTEARIHWSEPYTLGFPVGTKLYIKSPTAGMPSFEATPAPVLTTAQRPPTAAELDAAWRQIQDAFDDEATGQEGGKA